jgi:hypothetical protein
MIDIQDSDKQLDMRLGGGISPIYSLVLSFNVVDKNKGA